MYLFFLRFVFLNFEYPAYISKFRLVTRTRVIDKDKSLSEVLDRAKSLDAGFGLSRDS
jgi:hypothetical protein